LNYLPDYLSFRERHPTADYAWEGSPPTDQDFFDYISVAGAISFGEAMYSLNQSRAGENWPNLGELRNIFTNLLERIMSYTSHSTKFLSKGLSQGLRIEIISERVSQIILFAPRVVGEEWIRQFGSLCGRAAIPERVLEDLTEILSDRDIVSDMVEPTLIELNATAKIFPEEERQATD
jgi:hypothetical protein